MKSGLTTASLTVLGIGVVAVVAWIVVVHAFAPTSTRFDRLIWLYAGGSIAIVWGTLKIATRLSTSGPQSEEKTP